MAGKSTVANIIAEKLERAFQDTDDLIIKREKTAISDIFENKGEEYFRRVEKEIVREVSKKSGIVIATGGGVVLSEDNMKALRENGIIVNLKMTPEAIRSRVLNGKGERPVIKDMDMDGVLDKLSQREKYYADCDYSVEIIPGITPEEYAQMIIDILERNGEI